MIPYVTSKKGNYSEEKKKKVERLSRGEERYIRRVNHAI